MNPEYDFEASTGSSLKGGKRPVQSLELDIANKMSDMFLNSSKMADQLHQVAADPGSAGMLAAHTVLGVRDQMLKHDVLTGDAIWAADGGVLDNVVMGISKKLADAGMPIDGRAAKQIWDNAVKVLGQYDSAAEQAKQQQQMPQDDGTLSPELQEQQSALNAVRGTPVSRVPL